MLYTTAYDVCTESGAILFPDLDVRLDVSLELDNGEPFVSVDEVQVRDWQHKHETFVTVSGRDDPLCRWLSDFISSCAEKDDELRRQLVDDEGRSYSGRGSNDPDGYWRRAS